MMRKLVSLAIILGGASASSLDTCDSTSDCAVSKPALLQKATSPHVEEASQVNLIEDSATEEDGMESGPPRVTGKSATLDEAGYDAVVDLCCMTEMEAFIVRFAAGQGFHVCSGNHLTGFAVWFDCKDDLQPFAKFQRELIGIATSNCPWLKNPVTDLNCKSLDRCSPDYSWAKGGYQCRAGKPLGKYWTDYCIAQGVSEKIVHKLSNCDGQWCHDSKPSGVGIGGAVADCDGTKVYCAGGLTFGGGRAQVAALLKALANGGKHPNAP